MGVERERTSGFFSTVVPMTETQQKLADGMKGVLDLRISKVHNENDSDVAWANLKSAIVSARRETEVFDVYSSEDMTYLIEFLLQRGQKRKAAKGQVLECLKVLLGRDKWLLHAHKDAALRDSLKEAFASNPPIIEKLDFGPAGMEPEEVIESARIIGSDGDKGLDIKQQIANGLEAMAKFDWKFPHDPLGTKLDEATAGFQSLLDAITALTTVSGKASVDDDVTGTLSSVELEGENVMQFTLSMYHSGVRTTFKARIKFAINNLRAFIPSFRRLRYWRELPWGSEPMPPDEAEDEIRREEEAEAERIRIEEEKEAERIRIEQEAEAERIRVEEEKEAERLRVEEEQRRLEEEEARRLEEEARRLAEEEEMKRLAEEERLREEEERNRQIMGDYAYACELNQEEQEKKRIGDEKARKHIERDQALARQYETGARSSTGAVEVADAPPQQEEGGKKHRGWFHRHKDKK